MAFAPAQRRASKLRLALTGPAGAGKTYTMLQILALLIPNARVAVIDSESGSASKYARIRGKPVATREMIIAGKGYWDFGTESLTKKDPDSYVLKIREAAAEGISLLGIDSLTHSWIEALEMIGRGGGWARAGKDISPKVAKIIDSILNYPGHVVTTIRAKSEVAIEKDEKTGRTTVRKVGMGAVAREGTEFEFDVILDLAVDGVITVTKSRCGAFLPMNATFQREDIFSIVASLREWLDEGTPLTPCELMEQRIAAAPNLPALTEMKPEIKALAGTVDGVEVDSLRKAFAARKKTLIDEDVS